MSSAEFETAPTPAIPDYLSDPNAVLKDASEWRYGRAPDYSKTRTVFEQTKKYNHQAGSLPSLVENLVKNWEVEASFKSQLSDWRTVDRPNYSFAINGGPPQSAEHMLKVGTYNAIIAPNEFYSPAASDFTSSHKTFKRMMPTFAWEVMEVYSGPPRVAFRWRHWGEMKNDYVGFNDKGEKITAKAHNGSIDIEGVTVAQVDDQVRLQKVETWFDPLEMFRQIAPNGIVNKEVIGPHHLDKDEDQEEKVTSTTPASGVKIPPRQNTTDSPQKTNENLDVVSSASDQHPPIETKSKEEVEVTASDNEAQVEERKDVTTTESDKPLAQINGDSVAPPSSIDPLAAATSTQSKENDQLAPNDPTSQMNQLLKALESVKSELRQLSARTDSIESRIPKSEGVPSVATDSALPPGNALAEAPESEETRRTHEEMSRISAAECPFLMNQE